MDLAIECLISGTLIVARTWGTGSMIIAQARHSLRVLVDSDIVWACRISADLLGGLRRCLLDQIAIPISGSVALPSVKHDEFGARGHWHG